MEELKIRRIEEEAELEKLSKRVTVRDEELIGRTSGKQRKKSILRSCMILDPNVNPINRFIGLANGSKRDQSLQGT